jgi:hypothetical protein
MSASGGDIRNTLAIVFGILLGAGVNMGIVALGAILFPIESVPAQEVMSSFPEATKDLGLKHFIFPFLGHAFGTLVGAVIAARVAFSNKKLFALAIGFLFLVLGALTVSILQSPVWFAFTDLILAYIPMAILGSNWGKKLSKTQYNDLNEEIIDH